MPSTSASVFINLANLVSFENNFAAVVSFIISFLLPVLSLVPIIANSRICGCTRYRLLDWTCFLKKSPTARGCRALFFILLSVAEFP
jgi:hypothetical protein